MSQHQEPQMEIHLPDEPRSFPLMNEKLRCRCGNMAKLVRRVKKTQLQFRVECCAWSERAYDLPCNLSDPTPWIPSSQQAIQHWKLVAALSKP